MDGNKKQPLLGRNRYGVLRRQILEEARVPGAPSVLSGADHSGGESAATPGTTERIHDDGSTHLIFMFGVSIFGGDDYLAPYSRDAVDFGILTKKLS